MEIDSRSAATLLHATPRPSRPGSDSRAEAGARGAAGGERLGMPSDPPMAGAYSKSLETAPLRSARSAAD